MVNTKQVSFTAIAAVIVIAVVGYETYKSGNYSTSIKFHGSMGSALQIDQGQIFAESESKCATVDKLGRAAKGESEPIACLNQDTKRTEMRMELSNGLVVAMADDDVAIFNRTASGYEQVYYASADQTAVDAASDVETEEEDDKTMLDATTMKKVNGVVSRVEYGEFKIFIDDIASPGKDFDFTEESNSKDVARRALLQSRNLRSNSRKLGWVKKTYKKAKKWYKKNKKKIKCAMAIFSFGKEVVCCVASAGVCCGWAVYNGVKVYKKCS
jgi:hypothetical protein